jgi:hypothetical protein
MWIEKHTPVLNKELEQAQLPKALYQEFFAETNRLMQSVMNCTGFVGGPIPRCASVNLDVRQGFEPDVSQTYHNSDVHLEEPSRRRLTGRDQVRDVCLEFLRGRIASPLRKSPGPRRAKSWSHL